MKSSNSGPMDEHHQNEQYFFDIPSIEHLHDFVSRYQSPCCLCAPTLGRSLAEAGVEVTVLDIDRRFKDVPGFQFFDMEHPKWLDQRFDLIISDPPFFNVSLRQMVSAFSLLAHHDFEQKILVSYLSRRARAIEHAFKKFGIKATDYRPGYQTVRKIEKNDIQFFGNLSKEETELLTAT